jgi:hypothetical protein
MDDRLEQDPLDICRYCDEYHPTFVDCPYMANDRPLRRTTDVEDGEIERDAFTRHDRRLFG